MQEGINFRPLGASTPLRRRWKLEVPSKMYAWHFWLKIAFWAYLTPIPSTVLPAVTRLSWPIGRPTGRPTRRKVPEEGSAFHDLWPHFHKLPSSSRAGCSAIPSAILNTQVFTSLARSRYLDIWGRHVVSLSTVEGATGWPPAELCKMWILRNCKQD